MAHRILCSARVGFPVPRATYEVRLKNGGSSLVNEIAGINGVENAVLIAYNGDYVS